MVRGIFIALLLLVSVAPVHAGGITRGCLSADAASFERIDVQDALPGFTGWMQAVGYTLDRLPMTPTLLAIQGTQVCDLTHGLAQFLGKDASPVTGREAVSLATLAIGAIYVDVLPDPIVESATVTRIDGGQLVMMKLWTARNGVVADATVALRGDVDASFVVRDRAVGAFRGEPRGWNLRAGMTETTLQDPVEVENARILTGANGDGTSWRITYYSQNYANASEADRHAQMHLDGAIAAYTNITSWGLVSADPDGILDLTLDGCDCIYSGDQAKIHMFPRANDILPLVPGLAYRSESDTARLIVGHELFHHFQYSTQQWRLGSWLVEGMARFSETLNVPDATYLDTSLLYYPNDNGMNGFLLNPARGITQHSYDWSIVWGYLYAHEGGVALIKAVLEESASSFGDASIAGPAAIQRAMERVPGGEHATFTEAYRDLARAILSKDGFTWGAPDGSQVHDWSTYMVDVGRRASLAGNEALPQWAIQVHHAKPTNLEGNAAIVYAGAAIYEAEVMTVTNGEKSFVTAAPATLVAGAEDAVLVVTRLMTITSDPANAESTYAFAIAR